MKFNNVDTIIINEIHPKDHDRCEGGLAPGWKLWKHRRYVIAMLIFLAYVISFCTRSNLSVAIVVMTEKKSLMLENGTTIHGSEFDWDLTLQGQALSAFFYGFVLSQIPIGLLTIKFGGYIIFGVGIAGSAVLTLLTPILAKTSLFLLIAARFGEGIIEGGYYGCTLELCSKWVPPLERSRLMMLSFSGIFLGNAFTSMLSPYLVRAMGWPSLFYVFGCAAIIWLALWYMFASTSPESNGRISKEELFYIRSKIENSVPPKMSEIPWKDMATSMPLWAIIVAHVSYLGWGLYSRMTLMPILFKDVLLFDLEKTGLIACIPYLLEAFTSPLSGCLVDWLSMKKYFSITRVRKVFTSLPFFIQFLSWMAGAFWFSDVVVPICLILGAGIGAVAWAGFSVNYLDIAPQYAGIMVSIGNTISSIPGIVSPLVTGYLVTDMGHDKWKIIFYVAGGIYLFAAVFYATFCSADIQPWALSKHGNTKFKEVKAPALQTISSNLGAMKAEL